MVDLMIRKQVFMGRNVKESFKWLDLRPEDLRITRRMASPQTVDDPLRESEALEEVDR